MNYCFVREKRSFALPNKSSKRLKTFSKTVLRVDFSYRLLHFKVVFSSEQALSDIQREGLYDMQNQIIDYYSLLELYEEAEKEHEKLQQTLCSLDESNEYAMYMQELVDTFYEPYNFLKDEIDSLKLEMLLSHCGSELQSRQLIRLTYDLNAL